MSGANYFFSSFLLLSSTKKDVAAATTQHVLVATCANGGSKDKHHNNSNRNTNSSTGNLGFGNRERKEPIWRCAERCGACCKLHKGPTFATPEEIFQNPSDIQLYRSMIGPDGWCIHFEKTTRTCSIYSDRPYFCRVEPEIFQALYGIKEKRFNKEACSFCRDTIKAIYGAHSEELDNFNQTIRNSSV